MASSGNFCTINPLGAQGGGTVDTGTISNGNTAVSIADLCLGTVGVTSGKWYWEWALTGSSNSGMAVGWANQQVNSGAELGYNSPASATGAQIVYMYVSPSSGAWDIISDAPKGASSGTDSDKTGTVVQNDIISLAADFDNDKWYFGINGSYTAIRSGQDPASGTNPLCSASSGGGLVTISRTARFTWFPAFGNWAASTRDVKVNFGQDSTFSGSFSAGGNADENGFGDFKYSVPAGFKAMCSGNLPISDDIDPAQTDTDFPGKQFNTVLYTGNAGSNAITGLGFKPDFCWIKKRNSTGGAALVNSTLGGQKVIQSNSADAEGSSSPFQTFDADGFTLDGTSSYLGNFNGSSDTYVAWCWRANGGTTASNSNGSITSTVQANDAAGFSIITWTASGSNASIGHGLSAKPDFHMIKKRNGSSGWGVYHNSLGATKYLRLDSSNAASTSSYLYNDTEPDATKIYLGDNGVTNHPSGDTYICYAWRNVEGMQRFGTYEGNSNTDGPFIYTGFRPVLIFVKKTTGSAAWNVFYSPPKEFNSSANAYVTWNTSDAEANGVPIDFLSNGFKIRSSGNGVNHNSNTFVFGAWGDVPAKYGNTF